MALLNIQELPLKKSALITSILFLLILVGCETLNDQNPGAHFQGDQFPKALRDVSNPQPKNEFIKKFVEKNKTGRIKVAVIDSGFDYLHPDLINQVDMKINKEGKLTGIGYDVFGKDGFPHANNARPRLFALLAKEIKNGLIVLESKEENPLGLTDPIEFLIEIDKLFLNSVIKKIKDHEILKNTPFVKLENSHFNFISLYGIVLRELNPFNSFKTLRQYREGIKKGSKFFIKNGTTTINPDGENNPFGFGDHLIRAYLEMPWVSGDYDPIELYAIEHYDLAFEIFKEVSIEFDEKYNLKERFRNFSQFIGSKGTTSLSNTISDSQIDSDITGGSLEKTLNNIKYGYFKSDPMYKEKVRMCRRIDNKNFQILNNPNENINNKYMITKAYFGFIKNIYKTTLNNVAATKPDNVLYQIAAKDNMEKHLKIVDHLFNAYPKDYWNCHGIQENRNPFYEFDKRREHPYIDATSLSNNHGTHVAGIVAKQSPNIDIVPIKVVTETIKGNKKQIEENHETFLEMVEGFLSQHQVHLQVAINKILPYYPHQETEDLNEKKDLILEAMSRFVSSENNYYRLEFFKQLLGAIKYIGQEKIKLANVSLGLNSKSRSLDITDQRNLARGIEYIMMETYKWRVRETIKQYASNTLFVIAAGNSTQWIDGSSNQALPCVISSPDLDAKINQAEGKNVISSKMENILCVGSIAKWNDGEDHLSGFTNLIIDDLPHIFSYGENVLAPISTTSCLMNEKVYNLKSFKSYNVPSFFFPSDKLKAINASKGIIERDLKIKSIDEIDYTDEKTTKRINRLVSFYTNITSFFTDAINDFGSKQFCMEQPIHYAPLSGTSMASPHAAGFIASILSEKMAANGFLNNEVYELEEYSPENIIKNIFEITPEYGKTLRFGTVKKITDVKLYDLPSFKNFLFPEIQVSGTEIPFEREVMRANY